jgi:hypothetical protein
MLEHTLLVAPSAGLNTGPSEYGGATPTAPTVTAGVEFIFFFFLLSLVDIDQGVHCSQRHWQLLSCASSGGARAIATLQLAALACGRSGILKLILNFQDFPKSHHKIIRHLIGHHSKSYDTTKSYDKEL